MQIKGFGVIEKASKLADGEVEFVVSTNAVDAHGERIDVNGISLKEYKKNPVVLWGHDAFNLPIGTASKIWKSDNRLMARAKFDMSDEFAQKVYRKIKDGILRAVSIGGMVEEWADDGMTIAKLNMKEFSVVSVPANPEALATAKGYKPMSDKERQELDGLAKAYARKLLDDESELKKEVERLERLVATLKEVTKSETGKSQATNNLRIALKANQMVDKQAENISKIIKVELKGVSTNE